MKGTNKQDASVVFLKGQLWGGICPFCSSWKPHVIADFDDGIFACAECGAYGKAELSEQHHEQVPAVDVWKLRRFM